MTTLHLTATVVCDLCGEARVVQLAVGAATATAAREFMATQGWTSIEVDGKKRDHCARHVNKKAVA